MKKVLITPRSYGMYNREIWEMWEEAGFTVERHTGPFSAQELKPLLRDVHAMIAGTDEVSAEALRGARNLKIISKYGVGIDNIDKEYAQFNDIEIRNTPGVNTEAVADYTFGLMISLARHIPQSHHDLLKGKWEKKIGTEIWGKTIGILGLGAIGKAVARRAHGFGMKIYAYEPFPDHEFIRAYQIKHTGFMDVIQKCDIVTIHMPLTKETKHAISGNELHQMKPHSLLINTARGGIVHDGALYDALKNHVIGGAALDVFEEEPNVSKELLSLPNIVVTSHNASSSIEAVKRMTAQSTENVLKYFREHSYPDNR